MANLLGFSLVLGLFEFGSVNVDRHNLPPSDFPCGECLL